MRRIVTALTVYEEEHGEFPPAYTVDAEGNRLHSWRTLILPHMEKQGLYESIDLTEPWDDPANAKAYATVVECYACPSATFDTEKGLTSYLGVIGPACFFTGPEPRQLTDATDDHSSTIIVIEVPKSQVVHWMSPQDASESIVLGMNPESEMSHPGVALAAFLDGHAQQISVEVDKEVLRSMLTINADDKIEL